MTAERWPICVTSTQAPPFSLVTKNVDFCHLSICLSCHKTWGGRGVMVWAGIGYGLHTLLHFIEVNFNQEILRWIIDLHHLTIQKDMSVCALPGYAGTSLVQEGLPVLNWPRYLPRIVYLTPLVCSGLGRLPAGSSQFLRMAANFKRLCWSNGTTSLRLQLTVFLCPCAVRVSLCVSQTVDTRYWSLWIWTIDPFVFFLPFLLFWEVYTVHGERQSNYS